MELKKKNLVVILYLIVVCFTISIPTTEAYHLKEMNTIDHEKDRNKAKKWAENSYKEWKKKISIEEEKTLQKLLDPIDKKEENNMDHINFQLKAYGGDLTARPIDIPEKNKELKENVNRISQAINYKEGKLDRPLTVYKNATIQDTIHTEDNYFINEDGTLSSEKVKQLKEEFTSGQNREFGIFDLFEDGNKTSLVKWKILLPEGTNTGLLEEDKVVLDKDSAFKVTQVSIIVQKGKEYLRIEAKLVPKQTVENENQQLISKIKNDFYSHFNLPESKKFLDFKLRGSSNNYIMKKISMLLDKFVKNVDKNLMINTLEYMRKKGGYILLSDQEIYTLKTVYEPYPRNLEDVIDLMDSYGYYNITGNRSLSINLPADLHKETELQAFTLIHEFGHAVDNFAGVALESERYELSETEEFQDIFLSEGDKLTKYASSNSGEFFAEAFRMMHTPEEREKVKNKAPATFEFISEAIAQIIRLFPITA